MSLLSLTTTLRALVVVSRRFGRDLPSGVSEKLTVFLGTDHSILLFQALQGAGGLELV